MNSTLELLNVLKQRGIKLALDEKGKLLVRGDKTQLDDSLIAAIKQFRQEVIDHLNATSNPDARPKIVPGEPSPHPVLSFAQQRLWLLDRIDGGSVHYNIPSALKLSGRLDVAALARALSTIVERHESLRTVFASADDGQPYQLIRAAHAIEVPLLELAAVPGEMADPVADPVADAQRGWVEQETATQAATPFDLERDLMLRVRLLRLAENQHILLVTMHHIASDGWSMALLINEFSRLYAAYTQGQDNPLPALEIQYVDYARWQRQWLQGEVLDKQLIYWQRQLAGLPVVHSLPLDYPRPPLQGFAGQHLISRISKETSSALEALCQVHGATLFMGLHAAFSVLLARTSNETDIVMGSPIANREQAEVAGLIGFFVNTLILRSDVCGNPSFEQLLGQSKQLLLDAYAHQQVPFEQVVERLQPERSLAHSPLFQIMLVLQNNQEGKLELPGLILESVAQQALIAKYELLLDISQTDAGLVLTWEYNTDLFRAQTIERMGQHFARLLEAMVAQPTRPVYTLAMLSEAERNRVVHEFNATQTAYPNHTCIHELFEAQVARQPDALALVFEGEQLKYQELNQRANRLAHWLRSEKGVGPDKLVGLCIERSLDMVIAIVAILKAGGAYVPLDPSYPTQRLAYMLGDAQLDLVLTSASILAGVLTSTPLTPQQAVCLDDQAMRQVLAGMSADTVDRGDRVDRVENVAVAVSGLTPQHLAYMIYTSGSTGNPKGAMVEHQALVNRIDWMHREYGADSNDRILQKTPFSFDVSVWEFVWPLAAGAAIVLAKPDGHKDPAYLCELIRQQQVTKLHFVPSMLGNMLTYGDLAECRSLRQVFCSGEALPVHHVADFKAQCPWAQLHNLYGPTEAAIDVSYWDCGRADHPPTSIPIGHPIQNIQLYVLNPAQQPVPIGVAGELLIGGVGLARGYLNRLDLTAEKFIANPFHNLADPSSSPRLYRTGDLARWLENGNLEYLGRIDHQVKLRGFRIELGEIEAALTQHEQVTAAIVLARATAGGDMRLVAYVVGPTQATELNAQLTEQLRSHLSLSLPDYMLPSVFVVLDALPLSPNGKVERRALPDPDPGLTAARSEYVAPRSATEQALCQIWQNILRIERVGVTDNFFQLGGHSLMAMPVVASLRKLGLTMEVRALFTTPDLAALAAAIDDNANAGAGSVKPMFRAPPNLISLGTTCIRPEMLPLVELLQQEIDVIVKMVPGGAANIQDIYPLGPLQQGILYHHMMASTGDAYVTPFLIRVESGALLDNMLAALQQAINRHDVLRTLVLWKDLSGSVQVVCRHATLPVTWLKLDQDQDVPTYMQALCAPQKQWLDLSQAPLLRLQVAADPQSKGFFVLAQLHHMVDDATSLQRLMQEILMHMANRSELLPPVMQYREFVAHTLHQAQHSNGQAYFTAKLGDIDEPSIPFNLADVQGDGSSIEEVRGVVPPALASQIRRLMREQAMSPAALFHAVWAMVVAAACSRSDVVFGTVLSGRLQGTLGAEQMLGLFINTLPLRARLDGMSALGLIKQMQQELLSLLPYEQTPLARAQRCSAVPTGQPLFTAMLNYRHSTPIEMSEVEPGIEIIGGQERTNYPFNLSVDDLGEGFELDVQVDASIGAQRVLGYVQTALEQLVQAAQSGAPTQVQTLCVLPESERLLQLRQLNASTQRCSQAKRVHQLFEAHADAQAAAIALIQDELQVSYGALNQRANRLAHYLIATGIGIGPDQRIAICLPRGIEMVVGLLAILKAGAAYVCLDIEFPAERLRFMLDDAACLLVLTEQTLLAALPSGQLRTVCIDRDAALIAACADSNPTSAVQAHHLAYCMYTSGSTGQPKGVAIPHSAILGFMLEVDYVRYDHATVTLHYASASWDVLTLELWPALAHGGCCVLYSGAHLSPGDIGHQIRAHGVNTLWATAAFFNLIVDQDAAVLEPLAQLMVGGDQVSVAHVRKLMSQYPHLRVVNGYGPSECTVFSTCYVIPHDGLKPGASLPIGRPIGDRRAYVLDACRKLIPLGAVGELYVAGDSVAREYLNLPELSAEKFLPDPFEPDQRMYRTGDLVRWLEDGNLEFLGRIDQQVKIRGFRIELGEIEAALMAYEGIKDAVVLALQTAKGDKRLVAYLVAEAANAVNNSVPAAALRSHLNQRLPEYMVPSAFVLLDALPLTPNGKVDRKALPEPDWSAAQSEYVAPRTATEQALCVIWQETLDLERVGMTDNFFHLGGDSLSSLRLLAAVRMRFGVNLSLQMVFANPTIEFIAVSVDALSLNLNNDSIPIADDLMEEGVF